MPSVSTNTAGADLIRRLVDSLDGPELVERLRRDWSYARRPDRRLVECRVVCVYPRGERGFLIDYAMRFESPAGPCVERVFAELIPGDPRDRAATLLEQLRKKHRKQLSRRSPTDLVDWVADPGLVLRFRGLDERIDGLKLANKTRYLLPILSEHVAAGEAVELRGSELLGHRPGRRCVLRFRFASGGRERSIIAKLYPNRSDRGHRIFRTMRELWKGGFGHDDAVRIPRPIAYRSEWQLLLMEDVPDDAVSMADAGRALRELHRCPLAVDGGFSVDDEIELIGRWVELVQKVYPETGWRLGAALDRVRRALAPTRGAPLAVVHRDFHHEQVVGGPAGPIIVDFDTISRADAALDVGNFLAWLHAPDEPLGDVRTLQRDFLDGYGAHDAERVEAYRRSSMLRLACILSLTSSRHRVDGLLGELS